MNAGGWVLALILGSRSAFAAGSLDEKLSKQWRNYENARAFLLKRVAQTGVPIEKRLISRRDWEAMIALQGDDALTAGDLEALRKSQAARIETARIRARKDSIIDLDAIRARKEAAAFCAKFPKGGMLHVHPDGTFDRDTVNELLTTRNPNLPFPEIVQDVTTTSGEMLYPDELAWLKSVGKDQKYLSLSPANQARYETMLFLPPGKQPFERFESVFEFVGTSENDWNDEEVALANFARKAAREGVLYVEFTSGSSPEYLAVLKKVEDQSGLTIRVNRSFNRTQSPAQLDEAVQPLLASNPDPRIVGIDFLDNETGNPALEKGQMLYGAVLKTALAGKTRLHRTMHAGEIGDVRDPRDAMILGAERLGHGVLLAQDPVALEYAAKIHEPVEINLSSNLRLTSVKTIAEHPFLKYLRLGLPVSLSTDDEGIFDTDIDHDCELAVEQTDVAYSEMKRMSYDSIETSFASDADKKALLSRLNKSFTEFEKTFR